MKTKTAERAFWDTSAIVPLCCRQDGSEALCRLLRSGGRFIAWWGTPVEAHSAFRRLLREAALDEEQLRQSLDRLDLLSRSWSEVQPAEQVRGLAMALLDRHDLRSADALQLAAALVAYNERPRGRTFVCLDRRLAAAAAQAGFTVLPRRLAAAAPAPPVTAGSLRPMRLASAEDAPLTERRGCPGRRERPPPA